MAETKRPRFATNTAEWRRERAAALSELQRKRSDARQTIAPLELREHADGNTRTLRSYASLFDTPYTIRSPGHAFEETVKPGAFKRTLGSGPDVVFRAEHSGPPLGRTTSGTLRLGEDERGLWYEADLNLRDPDVQALVPKIERGDLTESSFAFRIMGENGDRWSDDYSQRDVLACDINRGDVSVVTFGASRATGDHMTLRSEESLAVLRSLGIEGLLEALVEWRDFTLRPQEQRLGAILSAGTMATLQRVLDLVANADDAVDEVQPLLADLMGVPNPDADDDDDGRSEAVIATTIRTREIHEALHEAWSAGSERKLAKDPVLLAPNDNDDLRLEVELQTARTRR